MNNKVIKVLMIVLISISIVLLLNKISKDDVSANEDIKVENNDVNQDTNTENIDLTETSDENMSEDNDETDKIIIYEQKPDKVGSSEQPKEDLKEEFDDSDSNSDVDNDGQKTYTIPKNNGFKSYMSYLSIKTKTSSQYKLQHGYAYTGDHGIRQVNGRYCVAIGTFTNAKVGTYLDVVLENGVAIKCIVGDFKADVHTDSNNIITLSNGCVVEFIVDKENLNPTAKRMGDVSYCNDNWKSSVKSIITYETNVFNLK